jgi:hypothetical protein
MPPSAISQHEPHPGYFMTKPPPARTAADDSLRKRESAERERSIMEKRLGEIRPLVNAQHIETWDALVRLSKLQPDK